MKLIIDTNIIISGLIKDSSTRKILLRPDIELYFPDILLLELFKYLPEIAQKADLPKKEIRHLLNLFVTNFHIVPLLDYKKELRQAHEIIGKIDKKDTPFIALALTIKCDGIWTEDKHFEKQNTISIFKTKDLIDLV